MSYAEDARVLGEGSFGCVLTPPVACSKTPQQWVRSKKKGDVGKVFFDKKDFAVEVRESKKVLKIDPRGKHILGPTAACETTLGKVTSHSAALEGCENVKERMFMNPATPMYQIIMPYGGMRYDKHVREGKTTLREFIGHMIHVLEGVAKLQRHKTCHQDLKASNLLIDARGNVMIIDYSLMLAYDEVYVKKNLRRLHHSYFPYPPEYKIFYLVYTHACSGSGSCPLAVPQVMKNLEHYGSYRKELFEKIHGGEKQVMKDVEALYDYVHGVFESGGKDRLESMFAGLAPKIDVYSVGTIMMDMDKYLVKTGQKRAAYQEAVRAMTMMDPRKRATVSVALKKLRSIL